MDIDTKKRATTESTATTNTGQQTTDSHMTLADISAKKSGGKGVHSTMHNGAFNISQAYKNNGRVEVGTIVSDRKEGRPSLGESLKDAFTEWWGTVTDSPDTRARRATLLDKQELPSLEIQSEASYDASISPIIKRTPSYRTFARKSRTFKKDAEHARGILLAPKNTSKEITGVHTVTPTAHMVAVARSPKVDVPHHVVHATLHTPSMVAPVVEDAVREEIRKYIPTEPVVKKNPLSKTTVLETIPEAITAPQDARAMEKNSGVLMGVNPVGIAPEVFEDINILKSEVISPNVSHKSTDTHAITDNGVRSLEPVEQPFQSLTSVRSDAVSIPQEAQRPLVIDEFHSDLDVFEDTKSSREDASPQMAYPSVAETVRGDSSIFGVKESPLEKELSRMERLSVAKEVREDTSVRESSKSLMEHVPMQMTKPYVAEAMPEDSRVFQSASSIQAESLSVLKSKIQIPEIEIKEAVTVPQPERKPYVYSPTITHRVLYVSQKWLVRISVASLGVVLAFLSGIYFTSIKNTFTPNESPAVIAAPAFFEVTQVPLPIEGDAGQFLGTLASFIDSATPPVMQFYPARATATSVRPATSGEFFTFIKAHLPEKAVRSLEDTFMIGSITTNMNEPFVVIRSYNFDVFFTGMLAWESYLYADFAPLIKKPIGGVNNFVDDIHENKPIRVLYDGTGKESLLYAFINQNTVIITTSKEALSKLLSYF